MPPIDFEASRGTMNPMSAPPPGFYKAKIEKAEMRQSTKTNSMYLNLQYKLRDNANKPCGSIFDSLFDPGTPPKPPLQFKLGQFLKATGLDTLKKGELTDIMKLAIGRELVVDVKNAPDNKGRIRGEVEPFARGGYAPISNWADCYARDGGVSGTAVEEEDNSLPFDLETPTEEPKPTKAKAAPPPPPPAQDDEF